MWPFAKKNNDNKSNEAKSDAKSKLAAQMMVGMGDLETRPRGEAIRALDKVISLLNEAAKLTRNPNRKARIRKSTAIAKNARKFQRKRK